MEQRLQQLLDRQEILDVLHRYARGLDRLDDELTRSCYFEDAIEDHGSFVGGREDFIRWTGQVAQHFVNTNHGILNHHCDLQGDDAHCETYFLFIGYTENGPHLMSMGRYLDHFQRREGAWKIANRVTDIQKSFELKDHPMLGEQNSKSYDGEGLKRFTRDTHDASYQRPLTPKRPAN